MADGGIEGAQERRQLHALTGTLRRAPQTMKLVRLRAQHELDVSKVGRQCSGARARRRRDLPGAAQGAGADRVGAGHEITFAHRRVAARGDEQAEADTGEGQCGGTHGANIHMPVKPIAVPRHCLYSGAMSDILHSPDPYARAGRRARTGHRRGPLTAALALLLVLALAPATALADTPSTLTVVGTSDVSDSGLMSNVLQPAFTKAYPQFTFKYIGTATGTAISDAESGSVGASALIVHAASLENQFVAGGFSAEQYGRAIFTNDFVLGGPTGDPAGVGAAGANNVAQAFADVATAGAAGTATFVSRGGTPGTTVEEHKLWALVLSAGLAPSSLLLCQVNATSGGGDTPIAAGHGVTASGQAVSERRGAADRVSAAALVRRHGPHPGPERDRGQQLQLPQRRLLRAHRSRHL